MRSVLGRDMGSATLLKGRGILIVEDHPVIRLELANLFESVGAQVAGVAKFEQAVMTIGQYSICAALLDHRLQEGNVAPLCALLTKFQIPYMIYTGYPDPQQIYPYATI